MNEPTLETQRLLLRPMQATDIDDLLLIFTDPKVMEAFDTPPFDHDQMAQWLQRNLDHQARYGYGLFSVILKSNGSLIGDCGLEVMEIDGVQVAELGYDFRSDYWNRGLATETATAVREYAFTTLELPRLISLIRVGNRASQRVAEKIGMTRISEFEHYGNRYWRYGIEKPKKELATRNPDMTEAEAAVREFIARINAHDADGIVAMCAADHVLIDSLGSRLSGLDELKQGWLGYLALFPDYRIEIQAIASSGDVVLASGLAGATHAASGIAWQIPAAWRARVIDGRVAEWQVYADNKPVYEILARGKSHKVEAE